MSRGKRIVRIALEEEVADALYRYIDENLKGGQFNDVMETIIKDLLKDRGYL